MPPSDCIFCRIASKQAPSNVVYESETVLAFLDINPIRAGHVQVIPLQHYPYYDDLPGDVAGEILEVGQKLAPVLRELFSVPRVAFLFTGGDVAHAHAHVVPMVEATDITSTRYIRERPLTFGNAPPAPPAELRSVAKALRARLSATGSGRSLSNSQH